MDSNNIENQQVETRQMMQLNPDDLNISVTVPNQKQ
jgi:hypothetical protein